MLSTPQASTPNSSNSWRITVVQRRGCDALLLLHENPPGTRKRSLKHFWSYASRRVSRWPQILRSKCSAIFPLCLHPVASRIHLLCLGQATAQEHVGHVIGGVHDGRPYKKVNLDGQPRRGRIFFRLEARRRFLLQNRHNHVDCKCPLPASAFSGRKALRLLLYVG